jgi:hypothetical protein
MPVVSRAQNAAMHAAEAGHSTLGIPQKVGAEFVKDQRLGSVRRLPLRVARKELPKMRKPFGSFAP